MGVRAYGDNRLVELDGRGGSILRFNLDCIGGSKLSKAFNPRDFALLYQSSQAVIQGFGDAFLPATNLVQINCGVC